MTTSRTFMKAILKAPDDDRPRLVYADWLDESGTDPDRAEFIRVQCELAAEPEEHACSRGRDFGDGNPHSQCPRCAWAARNLWGHALRRRERELEPIVREQFMRTLPGEPRTPEFTRLVQMGESATFRRGFVEAVVLPLAEWLAHGPALARACPLREVRLSDKRPAEAYRQRCWFASVSRLPLDIADRADVLPRAVWERLDRPDSVDFRFQRVYGVKGYVTEAEALADLSTACLKWANDEADRLDRNKNLPMMEHSILLGTV